MFDYMKKKINGSVQMRNPKPIDHGVVSHLASEIERNAKQLNEYEIRNSKLWIKAIEIFFYIYIFHFFSSSFTLALCIALCTHQRRHGSHPNHSLELEKE